MVPMSVLNRWAPICTALALLASPAAAQSLDDGRDPFEEDRAVKANVAVGGGAKTTSAAPAATEGNLRALEMENSLSGSTRLLRPLGADSGATRTLRVSLIGTYYTGSGFLCPVCENQNRTVLPRRSDEASQIGTRFALSVTPISFLEAFTSFRYQSTSNDQGDPRAIQIVGDMTFGVKAFMPPSPDRIFSFGGALDTQLLASAGGVG